MLRLYNILFGSALVLLSVGWLSLLAYGAHWTITNFMFE